MHHKLMQAMAERETCYVLDGQIQVDNAYLGGERSGGKAGRGSENKVPFVAAVSLSDDGRPLRAKLTPVSGFSLNAIGLWAKAHLAPGSTVFSDGLACFGALTAAGCTHQPTVVGGRKPKDLPEFQWINTVLGNLKTSLSWQLPCLQFPQVCGPIPRRVLLPIQPPIRSAHPAYATTRGCSQLHAPTPALDSHG